LVMSMIELNDWLEQIGLGKYAEVFSKQEIDTGVLRALTDGDLEKLGLPLGARKRLLAATARLGPDLSSDPCLVAAMGKPDRKASVEAEPVTDRRQLTVLFCDLVGSTELAAKLDPEDLREVIRSYHHCVADVLARFEGYAAQFLGGWSTGIFRLPQRP
jgi:class 3 adenylate cyclase